MPMKNTHTNNIIHLKRGYHLPSNSANNPVLKVPFLRKHSGGQDEKKRSMEIYQQYCPNWYCTIPKKKVKGTFLERTPQPLEHYLKTYRFVHVPRVHLGVRFGQAWGSGRLGELEQVGRPAAGRHSSSPGGHPWGGRQPRNSCESHAS